MKKVSFLLAVIMTLSLTMNLFATDPVMVKDINPGSGSSNINSVGILGDFIIFNATDGINGVEKWLSDGTQTGTYMIKNCNPSGDGTIGYGVAFNNEFYFNGSNGSDGYELWKTDGTESGTIMVKNIYRRNYSSSPEMLLATVYNNSLIFSAIIGRDNDREPMITDGTESGTQLIIDLKERSEDVFGKGSQPKYFVNLGDYFYFIASNDDYGRELWRSDGTETGTSLVKDINTIDNTLNGWGASHGMVKINDILYFEGNDGTNGFELWRSDGTESGTYIVKDINPSGNSSLEFDNYPSLSLNNKPFHIGNKFFFEGNDGTNGIELWVSEGTESTTMMVKDIYPGLGEGVFVHEFHNVVMNNYFYFPANDGINGWELWKTDGTELNTVMVKDINPNGDANPKWCTVIGDKVYFAADDGNGRELWETDGTETGTIKISTINASGEAGVANLIAQNNIIYFKADDGTNGVELWKYDPNAVDDTTPPVAVCQNVTVSLDVSGNASITAEDIDNGSTDDLGIASMTLDKYDYNCADVGANTVTLTVTDYGDNTDNCTATVTVQDNTSPDAQCQNVTVSLVDGSATVSADDIDNGSSDACGIASISLDQTSFTSAGDYDVTLTVTDNNSNTSTCGSVVTVTDADTEPPTISVSVSPTTLSPVNQRMNTITASVSVSDNLPGVSYELTSITSNQADDGLFKKDKANDIQNASYNTADTEFSLRAENYLAIRVYTIIYTAIDAADNTATATAYVTVPYSGKIAAFNDIINGNSLSIYPNPAVEVIHINLELLENQDITIKLYDILGVEHYSTSLTEASIINKVIDVKGLLPGIYFVEIQAGYEMIRKKIIKY